MTTVVSRTALVLVLLVAGPAAAADRYVTTRGADAGDCSLSTAPCLTLNYALTQALSGDTVKMAAGSYRAGVFIGASTTLVISGGWSTDFATHDPMAYRTSVRGLAGTYYGFNRTDVFTIAASTGDVIDLTLDGLTISRSLRGIVAGSDADAVLTLALTNSVLEGHIGGALQLGAGSTASMTVTVAGSAIVANSVGKCSPTQCFYSDGAGIRAGGSTLTLNLIDSTFARNRVFRGIGGSGGGGAGVWFGSGTLIVDGCVFSKNRVPYSGGGGLWAVIGATLQVTNSAFYGNRALYGGGLAAGGGDVSWPGTNVTIADSVFVGNTATIASDYPYYMTGGGAAIEDSTGSITNSTFSQNKGVGGGGPGVGGAGLAVQSSTLALRNSILWRNDGPSDLGLVLSNTVDADYDDIGVVSGSGFNDLGGNISADPLFVSPTDVHLTAGSPCVDSATCTGTAATDFEGDARPSGGGCDMGADEFVP